nr:hypothetical protein [Tanacetum cinerariifolium]
MPPPSIPTALIPPVTQPEVEILKLKDRVKVLEDREGIAATRSGDDALIKGRSIDEGAATERISDDSKELARVLTSMDVVTVLAGVIDVPTGSGSIPTAGPPVVDIYTGSDAVPTASSIVATATVVTPYSRRKGKEVMVESDTPKKQRLQEQIDAQVARELEEQQEREDKRMTEQIARDAEVWIHAEEELQGMIDSLDKTNETVAKYLQEYQDFASELPLERRIELISDLVKYQDNYSMIYKFQSQQRRPWTKKQKKDYYMTVIRNNLGWKVKDFKGMTFEEIEAKFAAKTSEEVPDKEKSPKEIPEEKVKEMRQFVPIEEVYVQALQVKHPIIDWKVYIEGQRSYWKIIRLGGSSACYQFFMDLLKHLDREDLNQLWVLVKEYLSIRPASSDKEIELWVVLKRLYDPDPEDQLWAQTQNYMHAPIKWKLYDLSGVHHVTAKDKEIFMLVEKDYPLRKGLALVMICYKLQVENFSQMENDLVLKIYKIANSPRQQVFATATVVTPYSKRKGKEVMVESDTLKKQKVQEQIDTQVARELEEQLEREDQRRYAQIARDAEIARIHVKEELQIMIDGSKEEAERIKRKGINLEQETKKQKISEEVTKKAKTPNEVPGEKVKEMMQLVPIEEVFVEALQVKHPIIDCKLQASSGELLTDGE